MSNGVISKEDFERIKDTNVKLNILFETMISVRDIIGNQNKRIRKIENRPLYDKASSFVGGIVGGIIAIAGKWIFFRE